jgi:hypothetical protein
MSVVDDVHSGRMSTVTYVHVKQHIDQRIRENQGSALMKSQS